MDHDDLSQACPGAEELVNTECVERAKEVLASLADAHPSRPEPRVSLARVHRWLGLQDMHRTVNRAELFEARRWLLAAVDLQSSPDLQVLSLLRDVTHDLAMHEEQARYFAELAQRDPRPQIRCQSLGWASVALECRGQELTAAGQRAAAVACFEQAVASYRRARAAWPEAPIAMTLDYLGGHTMNAYVETGRHAEWIALAEVDLASAEGQALPAASRAFCLVEASDVAARGELYAEAARLAARALDEWQAAAAGETEGRTRLRVRILGQLLLACKGQSDLDGMQEAARQILGLLADLEKGTEQQEDLRACYNLATRTFIVAEEWDLAVPTARRATEVWDFGPNFAFLAAALWAGFRDRAGALEALRNAARDARLSGKGMCRNLRDDFLRSPHFADVRDDPEFLTAVEVPGVVD